MRTRHRARTVIVLAALVLALAGAFALGRFTAPGGVTAPGSSREYAAGLAEGRSAGLATGHAEGLAEGRALQEGQALPPDARQPVESAFRSGYLAGANDTFSDFDGGWVRSRPYLVVLGPGTGGVTYRFATRVTLAPGVSYYLCPASGSTGPRGTPSSPFPGICQEPRR